MPPTPQHNMRIEVDLWAMVEAEAQLRQGSGPHYSRTFIVNEALKEYFSPESRLRRERNLDAAAWPEDNE